MEFLFEYGLFLAKAVTIVTAIGASTLLVVGLSRRGAGAPPGLAVEKLNDRYRELAAVLRRAVLPKAAWKKEAKREEKERKARDKAAKDAPPRRRVFVLDFKGDIKATAVASLREEINAIIAVATPRDEVVLRLENFGGVVHEHGLAASQLARLRSRELPLTVIVDKAAASGGYMMACIARRIIAAPFAVIGSIGVLAQIPNFNRLLTERGVDFEQITAGRYKRTVTMFGRNTDEDRAKLQEDLEDIHALFKQLVTENRPQLDVERVATGEHWYGTRALALGLVDEIGSSDDYLLKAATDADVFHLAYRAKHTLPERLLAWAKAGADQATLWAAQRQRESQLP